MIMLAVILHHWGKNNNSHMTCFREHTCSPSPSQSLEEEPDYPIFSSDWRYSPKSWKKFQRTKFLQGHGVLSPIAMSSGSSFGTLQRFKVAFLVFFFGPTSIGQELLVGPACCQLTLGWSSYPSGCRLSLQSSSCLAVLCHIICSWSTWTGWSCLELAWWKRPGSMFFLYIYLWEKAKNQSCNSFAWSGRQKIIHHINSQTWTTETSTHRSDFVTLHLEPKPDCVTLEIIQRTGH